MTFTFSAELIEWRGPAPWFFVPLPQPAANELADVAAQVTYGWGCIPAEVVIGETRFETSLIPKDGTFFVPVKAAVRRAEGIELGDVLAVEVRIAGA